VGEQISHGEERRGEETSFSKQKGLAEKSRTPPPSIPNYRLLFAFEFEGS
jgi:hypothetical protein